MSKKDPATNSALDLIFRPPKKLTFTKLYRMYFDEILRLMYRILIIKNVPETIDETFLKMILFTQGKIVFFEGQEVGESASKLLALNCSRANMPNVYYQSSQFLVANPRLLKSYTLTPGVDCEVIYLSETDKYNLSEMNGGLYELISRTATIMADNDLSLNIAQKNTRLTNISAAQTQNAFESLQAVINAMYAGDPNIVVKGSLIDQLQNIPIMQNQSNQNLLQLIEVNQYVLAHFLEKIGICVHDQMKRERLVTGEINDNYDLARFNIDDMIMSLNAGFSLVNSHFGTDLECELNPIILHQDQTAAALPAAPKEPDQEEPDQEEPDQEEPDQEEPDQEEPDQKEPDQEEPDQEEPDQEEPDQKEPDQEEPDQEEPDQKEPDQKEPDQEEPDQEEPDQEEPDQKEPDQEEPDQEEPDQEEPDQKEPDQEEPDQKEPDQKEPDQEEQNDNTIEVTGDNNVIIIGGDENGIAERSAEGGASEDMGGNPGDNDG